MALRLPSTVFAPWLAVWRRLCTGLGLVLVLVVLQAPVQAQDLLPVPALTARIMDSSGTLAAQDVASIEQQLAALEQRSGTQVVVWLLPSTAPEDIFSYANRVANEWKIGRKDVGDGLLIVVAVQDRRMRIEVAKTLEGAIPDLAAKQIIERDMTPAFKRGDYAGGLKQAIESLGQRITGEHLPAPAERAAQSGFSWGDNWSVILVAVLVVSQMLRRLFGRGLGAVVTGVAGAGLVYVLSASLLLALGAGVAALVWSLLSGLASTGINSGLHSGSGRGRGGWGGGWGGPGGGGFSSGGGGDFGGGGASGKW